MAWTDATIKMLADLWSEGLSCSQIAQRINSAHGTQFSRNAVIGKRSRMGMPNRVASMARHAQRRPHKTVDRPRVSPVTLAVLKQRPPLDSQPLPEASSAFDAERARVGLTSLIEIEDHACRWPIGDPQDADFGFCGVKAVPDQPYCKHHTSRAFNSDRRPRVRPKRTNPYLYQPTKSKELV